MNYTKGEWKVNIDNGARDFGGKVGITASDKNLNIAYNIGPNMQYNHPENLANAHLIAAAPMMYEALKEIQKLMDSPIETFEEFQEIAPPIFNKGKQALAKAEGKEV